MGALRRPFQNVPDVEVCVCVRWKIICSVSWPSPRPLRRRFSSVKQTRTRERRVNTQTGARARGVCAPSSSRWLTGFRSELGEKRVGTTKTDRKGWRLQGATTSLTAALQPKYGFYGRRRNVYRAIDFIRFLFLSFNLYGIIFVLFYDLSHRVQRQLKRRGGWRVIVLKILVLMVFFCYSNALRKTILQPNRVKFRRSAGFGQTEPCCYDCRYAVPYGAR